MLDGWVKSGPDHAAEGDGNGHLGGQPGRESTDLLMNVEEEGPGLPAAMLLDGFGRDAIEVHSHGSTSTEGVAADVFKLCEANGISSIFDSCVDVILVNVSAEASVDVVVKDAAVGGATIGEDVVDSPGKGFDRAVDGSSAVIMDALPFDSILLVGDGEGGLCC